MVSRSQTCMNKLRVLSRLYAPSPLQPFGIRSFCAKSMRKTTSSSCLDARQMCASVCASTRLRTLGSLFIHSCGHGQLPANMDDENHHCFARPAPAWLPVFIMLHSTVSAIEIEGGAGTLSGHHAGADGMLGRTAFAENFAV